MTSAVAGLVLIVLGALLHARAIHRVKKVCADPWMICLPSTWLADGIFRLRHPAYIGVGMEISGAGMVALDWWGAVLVFAAMPFYADRILREESIRRGW